MSVRSTVVALILCAVRPAEAAWLGLTYKSSTYIGGSFEDEIRAVATDTSGAMYVAGQSVSSDLPTTAGTFQPSKRAGMVMANGFVAKVAPDGSLVWLTYLGGSLGDAVAGIAVDSLGNVFVTGQTQSSDFPTTPNGFRPTCGASAGSCIVGFLSELSPDGKALLWSSFIAGDAIVGVEPRAIVLSQGLACVTGSATVPTLPVTPDAPQKTLAGATDVFVSCFDPSKSGSASLAFSTFYGGSGSDDAYGIAADPTGRLFVAGRTDSNDFPVVNAAQPAFGGSVSDAFVLALSPTRSVAYATYFGGSNIDYAAAIAAAPDGSAYITGQTKSSDLPVRTALQPIIGGGPYYGETFGDAFVAKLDPTGALSFSTFLGGFTFDWGRAIAVGADGVVHVCGATDSFDFPTLPGAPDLLPQNQTAFATGLLPDGSGAVYSTLYRAIYDPFGCAFATDLVIGGEAHSGAVAIDHPVRPYTAAGADGFVARLSPGAPGISDLEVSGAVEAGRSGTLGAVLTLTNHGPDTATGLLIRASNSPGATFTGPGVLGSMLGISTLFEVADLSAGASTAVPLVIAPAYTGPFDISFWTLGHQADPNSGNDTASFHANIAESHLAAAVAVSPPQSAQGEEVVASIDVSNPGPDAAKAVEVVVSPAGGRPGTAGLPSGCRIETPPLITCALGDVAVGAGAHVDLPIQLIMGGGPMAVEVEASSMSLQSPLDGHAVATVDVAYADAVLGASRLTGTVDAGQTASYALELRTTSGVYLGPWSVSCSAPGNGITCALDPASLDPGGGVARSVLSVSTAARTVSAGSMGRPSTLPAMFVLLFVAGMALASGTVRVPFALGRFAVGLFAGASIFACGCSSSAGSRLGQGGTPAGTYVVTVTATLGKVPDGFAYGVITRTTQVTLTVR
jgi:beta-propeller repeat-containing protein